MKLRSNWLILSGLLFLADVCFGALNTNETPWHVQGTPEVVSQTLQFSKGDAHLVGTLFLPAIGDHLPAVVALHSASAATRDAGLYRHLSEGLQLRALVRVPILRDLPGRLIAFGPRRVCLNEM